MTRLSETDLQNILKRGHCSITGEAISRLAKATGRVRSNKIEIDGHVFDSRAEASIYSEFKIDPDIKILEIQPCFVLLKPFKRKNRKHRGVIYTPDFKVEDKGVKWIVEVKSKGTIRANSKSYPIRRKLFLHKFPELNFREIIFDGKQRTIKEY